MYSSIICDPGDRKAEGNATGLLYTAVSRATTLGDKDGFGSAIYFTGMDFKEDRIRNITKKKDSIYDYKRVRKRKIWVNNLSKSTKKYKLNRKLERALAWGKSKRYNIKQLADRIDIYKYRQNASKIRTW